MGEPKLGSFQIVVRCLLAGGGVVHSGCCRVFNLKVKGNITAPFLYFSGYAALFP